MKEINVKEREKIEAIEKLKKEMKYKIRETKANLIALNEEQMETTTRLKILQNHQLTLAPCHIKNTFDKEYVLLNLLYYSHTIFDSFLMSLSILVGVARHIGRVAVHVWMHPRS